MPSTREIARALWARCLEAEHKPGRVQFTKYLYLIDYCYWRFRGQQATDANWIFYHYGPWAAEAHEAMDNLAAEYDFHWREEEEAIVRFVRVEEPQQLEFMLENIIHGVLKAFKYADLNRVLEFAYNQTEPMQTAKRGDRLDFNTVPVSKSMPVFTEQPARDLNFTLSPSRSAQLAAFREKRASLQTVGKRWRQEREKPAFHQAMDLLREETVADLPADSLRLDIPHEAISSLNRE